MPIENNQAETKVQRHNSGTYYGTVPTPVSAEGGQYYTDKNNRLSEFFNTKFTFHPD